jgi:hypothetical protein
MAKIGVTLWCHLLIRQDVLKKIVKLNKGNLFPIRIRTGCIPNLVRLVTTLRTFSVILGVYLIKRHILNTYLIKRHILTVYVIKHHILNVYIKTTIIYMYSNS